MPRSTSEELNTVKLSWMNLATSVSTPMFIGVLKFYKKIFHFSGVPFSQQDNLYP